MLIYRAELFKILEMKRLLASPLLVAIAYALAIPVFAAIYCKMPQQFYQQTIPLEAGYKEDEDALSGLLAEVIKAHYTEGGTDGVIKSGNNSWYMKTAKVKVKYAANGDSEEFRVAVHVRGSHFAYRQNSAPNWQREINLTIPLWSEEKGPDHSYALSERENARNDVPAALLFPEVVGGQGGSIALDDPQIIRAIDRLRSGSHGVTSSVTHNYLRMFYFSAITITTVGFGDILPISGLARTCVAVEAILGIVLIGFFINAVGLRLQAEKK